MALPHTYRQSRGENSHKVTGDLYNNEVRFIRRKLAAMWVEGLTAKFHPRVRATLQQRSAYGKIQREEQIADLEAELADPYNQPAGWSSLV